MNLCSNFQFHVKSSMNKNACGGRAHQIPLYELDVPDRRGFKVMKRKFKGT